MRLVGTAQQHDIWELWVVFARPVTLQSPKTWVETWVTQSAWGERTMYLNFSLPMPSVYQTMQEVQQVQQWVVKLS